MFTRRLYSLTPLRGHRLTQHGGLLAAFTARRDFSSGNLFEDSLKHNQIKIHPEIITYYNQKGQILKSLQANYETHGSGGGSDSKYFMGLAENGHTAIIVSEIRKLSSWRVSRLSRDECWPYVAKAFHQERATIPPYGLMWSAVNYLYYFSILYMWWTIYKIMLKDYVDKAIESHLAQK
jgi:hypothetical protein